MKKLLPFYLFSVLAFPILFCSCTEKNPDILEFAIFSGGEQYEITNPIADATCYIGTAIPITWTKKSDVSSISLFWTINGQDYSELNIPNTGTYNWNIPTSFAEGQYKITIRDAEGNKMLGGMKGVFSLQRPPLLLSIPNGQENWFTGRTYDIEWSSNGQGSYVNIELWKGGNFLRTIVANQYASSQYYSWTIPTTIVPGSDYKIKIIQIGQSTLSDMSDNLFSISTAKLKFEFPVANFPYIRGKKFPVFWSAPNGTNQYCKIQLYKSSSLVTEYTYITLDAGAMEITVSPTYTPGNDYYFKIVNSTTSETAISPVFRVIDSTVSSYLSSFEPNDVESSAFGPLIPNTLYTSYVNSSTDLDWYYFDIPDGREVKVYLGCNSSSLYYYYKFKSGSGFTSYYNGATVWTMPGGRQKFQVYGSGGSASSTEPYYFIYSVEQP